MSDDTIRSFITRQKELLSLELETETGTGSGGDGDGNAGDTNNNKKNPTSSSSSSNDTLRHLDISNTSIGLYGRTVISLVNRGTTTGDSGKSSKKGGGSGNGNIRLLPGHHFTVGDDVDIRSETKRKKRSSSSIGGVICKVTEFSISVALFSSSVSTNDDDDDDSPLSPPLRLSHKSSAEIHAKIIKSLSMLEQQGANHDVAGDTVRMMFDPKPLPSSGVAYDKIDPYNNNLNPSQIDAISFCLSSQAPPVSLIHGPPGTGKTTTLVELILQSLQSHAKILCCAPSNVAVDNLIEKLATTTTTTTSKNKKNLPTLKMLRLGHPARIKPQTQKYSLEHAVNSNTDSIALISDAKSELRHVTQLLSTPRQNPALRRQARQEAYLLRKEIRTREEQVISDLLNSSQIILCTLVGAASRLLNDVTFDLVIIDEAAQALECACWIPLLKARRAIIAGDPLQLPPTVKHPKAERELSITLMERVWRLYGRGESVGRMLDVQYRMNKDISDWCSERLYDGKLKTWEGVRDGVLGDLAGYDEEGEWRDVVMLLVDTAGCGVEFEEEVHPATGSRRNEGEGRVVERHVRALLSGGGLKPEDLAVISPYSAQVELLRSLLLGDYPTLEIKSVDGFQGGEKEAVILSLVRSNRQGELGFLKERRRLNVAVTRAKKHLCVVGNAECIERDAFIKGLLTWIEDKGDVRSAMDFLREEEDGETIQMSDDVVKKMMRDLEIQQKNDGVASRDVEKKEKSQKKPPQVKKNSSNNSKHKQTSSVGTKEEPIPVIKTTSAPMKDNSKKSENDTSIAPSSNTDNQQAKNSIRMTDEDILEDDVEETSPSTKSAFNLLEESSDDDNHEQEEDTKETQSTESNNMNSLLNELAKERQQRQRQQQQQQQTKPKGKSSGKKKNKTKKPKTPTSINNNIAKDDDDDDDDDDMAFLNRQIQNVQNSHGRKIEATGSKYKTIVNGFLVAKPKPDETKKKDAKASAALRAKLYGMEDDRKVKKKKNKKKR